MQRDGANIHNKTWVLHAKEYTAIFLNTAAQRKNAAVFFSKWACYVLSVTKYDHYMRQNVATVCDRMWPLYAIKCGNILQQNVVLM